MPNHPNRNWRRVAHEAADAELSRMQWRDEIGALLITQEQLREKLRQWFVLGFDAGRRGMKAPGRYPL
jgi:hypothetical protein